MIRNTVVCLCAITAIAVIAAAPLGAQQGPSQVLEVPVKPAGPDPTGPASPAVAGVAAAAFDLAKMPIYDRVKLFLKVLDKGGEFQVILSQGKRRRSLRFKPHHDLSKVTTTITKRGFKDTEVVVVRRVVAPHERVPSLLLLQNRCATLMAAGPSAFVDRLRTLVAGEAPKAGNEGDGQPRSLKEIYERARFREGPRPPAIVPIPYDRARKIGALAAAGDVAGLIRLIGEAREEARKAPGGKVQGKPWLGEPFEYHKPSEGEIVLSEAGWALKGCIAKVRAPEEALRCARSLATLAEVPAAIGFERFEYHSVDVVGSGRFSYPSAPRPMDVSPLRDLVSRCLEVPALAPIRESLRALGAKPRGTAQERAARARELLALLEGFSKP